MKLEQSIIYYLEIRKRNGILPETINEERRRFDCYLAFCKDRNLKGRERIMMETIIMYRNWLKEQPSLSVEDQKQHLDVLFRLADFLVNYRKPGYRLENRI